MKTIYLDVDDTLADFKTHALSRGVPPWEGTWYTQDPSTWTAEQKHISDETIRQMAMLDFWETMPMKDGAFEIISAAASRRPTFFLTALPRGVPDSMHEPIRQAKIDWAERVLHFPAEKVIVCWRREKIGYARTSAQRLNGTIEFPNVIVDDAIQTCEEWAAAGGHAILHEDPVKTVRRLKAV